MKQRWQNGDNISVNDTLKSIGKKGIIIFIRIHVQYELQSQVSIIEHHPQGN